MIEHITREELYEKLYLLFLSFRPGEDQKAPLTRRNAEKLARQVVDLLKPIYGETNEIRRKPKMTFHKG